MRQKVLYVNKSTGVKPALKTEEEMYYKWQHETWIVWAGTGEYWNGLGRKRHGTICISVGRQAPEMQCGVSGTGSVFDGQDRQYRITIKSAVELHCGFGCLYGCFYICPWAQKTLSI